MTPARPVEGALLFERPRSGERAILVHVELPAEEVHEDLSEFQDLARAAGATIVSCLTATRGAPAPRFFVGKGKAEELRSLVASTGAELVIFNHSLTPAQERNLEQLIQCRVLDRIGLILDIFAQRASTFEGQLQVELAQLRHLSTRLVRGWTHLERQKGGIGLRGPGEKQLESDRRLIAERIRRINQQIERVAKRRDLSRRARTRNAAPVVALVGYTNAGKSTLFNRLTGAQVPVMNQLFATLDPTLRRLELASGSRVILADTVGFIRHLPHELVAAFRATLEETRTARLLLHVIDASAAGRREKQEQVNAVLTDIGARSLPQIEVYNKIDAGRVSGTPQPGAGREPRVERDVNGKVARVWVSARTGAGLDLLRSAIDEFVGARTVHREIHLPVGAGRLRARLFQLGTVLDERPGTNGEWVMDVEVCPGDLQRLCEREGLDPTRIAGISQPPYDAAFSRVMRG